MTDEFLSYLAAAAKWDLGQATEFLVVAATLLDLKTARLLPSAEVEDDEDIALLEARDLLFARLLQYRAFKLAAAYLAELRCRPSPSSRPFRRTGSVLYRDVAGCGHRREPSPAGCLGGRRAYPAAGPGGGDRPRSCSAGKRPGTHGDPARTTPAYRFGDFSNSRRGLRVRRSRSSRDSWVCSSCTSSAPLALIKCRRWANCEFAGSSGHDEPIDSDGTPIEDGSPDRVEEEYL